MIIETRKNIRKLKRLFAWKHVNSSLGDLIACFADVGYKQACLFAKDAVLQRDGLSTLTTG